MPENLIAEMLLETETELRSQINRLNEKSTGQFVEILTYHMGWTGEKGNEFSKGKRIRPLLLLLCSASGIRNYDWHNALPGAVAIELIHNFALLSGRNGVFLKELMQEMPYIRYLIWQLLI
jgi:geranylgeranyl diphosphate synthase type I